MTAAARPRFASVALVVLVGAIGVAGVAQRQTAMPDLQTAILSQGPYSRMHMLLEKTFLRVNVLTVEVQVGEPTRQRIQKLAAGSDRLDPVEEPIVAAVLDADHVLVTLEFQRGVEFDRWLEEVRKSLQTANKAGLVPASMLNEVSARLPEWFKPFTERGWADGDRIVYRGYPESMRTLALTAAGEMLVDRTDPTAAAKRSMLAGYFAPGTDFRKPLVASLRAR
jgi:hypothetical protein